MEEQGNSELLEAIRQNAQTNAQTEAGSEPVINYLVFKVGLNCYAVESSMIQEVMRNSVLFPLPFVPDYMKGIINFYGKPLSVIDLALFQDFAPQNEKLFLVLKNDSDIAFQVTEILEFHSARENSLQKISGTSESSYFTKALNFNDGKENCAVPVLNINGIIAKIRLDLENS